MEVTSVGIVGYGSFGELVSKLIQRFAPEISVKVYSHDKKTGKTFFSLAETAKSDVVILAVPIHAFEEALKGVLKHARKDTVLVDVSTVKVYTAGLLKKWAKGRRYISTHPMWGPESYEKRGGDVAGFRIVVAEHTLPRSLYASLLTAFNSIGFNVVEMSADAHDKYLAETLFLTHFLGQTIIRGGFERTDIDTVSFGFLMDAVESVRHDEKLFADVFRFNPYCRSVLDAFEKAESDVRTLLESVDSDSAKHGIIIGVSGAKGSFSEEAARIYAKKSGIKRFSLAYLISVEGVLSALGKREIDIGIFPIQNSIGGIVTEAVKPMRTYDFKIHNVFDIDIRQNLMVRKGVAAKDIRAVSSHEQALKQCKSYLKREWPKAKIQIYEDTAKAAEDLAKGKLPKTTAVIASKTAADVYKLKILGAGIQDLKTNFTTFIAAKR